MVNTPVPVGSGTVEFPITTALMSDVETSGIVEVVAFNAITIVPIVTVVVSVSVLLGVIWQESISAIGCWWRMGNDLTVVNFVVVGATVELVFGAADVDVGVTIGCGKKDVTPPETVWVIFMVLW